MRTLLLAPILPLLATPALAAQSPIDIRPRDATFTTLPALRFDYAPDATLRLVNTGSPDEEATIRADVEAGAGVLTIGSTPFDLLQFHFHAESEHSVAGVRAEMELHLVHRAGDGTLAVVGRFVEEGPENALLAPFFAALPPEPAGIAMLSGFNLRDLLPPSLLSWRYEGSLTTPPFSEGVRWTVLAEPLFLSASQIANFRALFPDGNARDVQPLGGRPVVTDIPGFAIVPEPATWLMLIAGFGLVGLARRRLPPQGAVPA